MRVLRSICLVLVTAAVPLAAGCGPVISSYLILSAQAEIDGAEAAEAEKYAPYHYTAAKEYIQKAREEQGYAEFQPAIEFAYRAKEHAEQGRAQAEEMKKNNIPPPAPKTPVVEPVDAPPTDTNPTGTPPDEPRETPNIIIKKKAPPTESENTTPNVTVTPKAKAPAPGQKPAPKSTAPAEKPAPKTQPKPEANPPASAAPETVPAPETSGDEAEKKPRGPIIIPIQPSTNTGD